MRNKISGPEWDQGRKELWGGAEVTRDVPRLQGMRRHVTAFPRGAAPLQGRGMGPQGSQVGGGVVCLMLFI